jgi:D-sedoheptulose 7-phosphate isomerase
MSRSDASAGARPVVEAHLARLRSCLEAVPASQIAEVAERLWQVARAGGLIMIAGNGGSAATASHMALDFGKSTLGRPPRADGLRVRTVCLSDPTPVLTAWANDEGYELVFAEQVTSLARPGDAVVLLSVSGTSPNIVAAARAARKAGEMVIALLGGRGGNVRDLADLAVVVPSEDYGVVEDVHLAIDHMVTNYLRETLGSEGRLHGESRRGKTTPASPRRPNRSGGS